jgi:hypothetical protein
MTTSEQKDRDGQSPDAKTDEARGSGAPRPGLVIEMMLPKKKPEAAPDPKKQN